MDLVRGVRYRKKAALKDLLIPKKKGSPKGEREGMDNGDLTEEDEQPLSPAARLFHQPHFNCYIIAIMGCCKKFDVNVVKGGLEVTLIRHPRFSSIQVLDDRTYGKWVRTKVVLENHVIVPDLDPNMESPDKFVEDYASDLTKTSLDFSKPLWDFHILNVKTKEAESTAIFRIHHSLGDGTSLISLLLACTRRSSDPNLLPTIPGGKMELRKRSGFLPFLARVWAVFRLVWNTMVDVLLFIATFLFLKDTETPLKGVEGVEFHPKRFVHWTLSLDDFKMVKSGMNSTINDVMLGVTSAGLTRYLNRRYDNNKAGNNGKHNLPENIRLRATLLVNIRSAPGIHALADMMEKDNADAKWGNWVGYVLLPFSLVKQDDPLDYVRKAKAITDRKKHSYESLLTFASGSGVVNFLGIKAVAHLSHRVFSNTTMSFSNVVGPMEEISFYGHPMAYVAPSVYGHPHALTIHFQSYMDKVKMVLAVDESAIPDPYQLCEDLADSLRLIKNAVLARK
ncbi:wax ester synthase/diacylglycerol acyltransferase 11-like [Tasmannia lanceolata]|uniref:wax ester synthase/diacylglycerol acyltransferase 11-like n=1 Tax=Tasmannia lanceolata TaxID=3420 RepID=UPI004063234F